eukprot:jgi/Botrbrau1/10711/Bobra.357_1s0013.1
MREISSSQGRVTHESMSQFDEDADIIPIFIEVCQRSTSTASSSEVQSHMRKVLQTRSFRYAPGALELPPDDEFINRHIENAILTDTNDPRALAGCRLLYWQVQLQVSVFQLCEDGGLEDDEVEESVSAYKQWQLPAREFHTLWDSLVYESDVKQRLLQYADTALLFSERRVNANLVSFNRTVLLHGPPGTGKTSLCKALAQKLAIRFNHKYQAQLVEVHGHSIFSKWFSESGKLVARLFAKIMELVEDQNSLVFVLIDEVESLTAARKAAVAGSEPADAIRAVNALLTSLDSLKAFSNVMVMTTSNITEAIDLAFVDRADIKVYIGPPGLEARYEILRTCFQELQRVGIVEPKCPTCSPFASLPTEGMCSQSMDADTSEEDRLGLALLSAAHRCKGLSGRALRKLFFLALAASPAPHKPHSGLFCLELLSKAIDKELEDRGMLEHGNGLNSPASKRSQLANGH